MSFLAHPARRRVLSSMIAMTGVFVSATAFASPAFAHAELVSSTPADGATLNKAPTSVILTFGEPILSAGSGIIVNGPDDNRYDLPDTLDVGDTEASVALKPANTAGEYTVEYRIVAEDGHVGTGTLTYTLKGETPTSTLTPTPNTIPAAPSVAGDESSSSESGASSVWVLGLGAIGLVLLITLVVAFFRGRRA